MQKSGSARELDSLQLDRNNANKGTKRGKEVIRYSLREYGYGRSLVLDKKGRVIAGNKTLQSAKELGAKEVVVVQTTGEQLIAVQRTDLDLDHAKARALAVADNRACELNLEWDRENIKQLASEVNLSALFDETELDLLIGPGATDMGIDEQGAAALECAEELQQKWQTAPGQIWEIPSRTGGAAHRLSCCDSTDSNAVARLLAGKRAHMTFTDPPWNVNINGGDHGNRKRKGIRIANDSMTASQFSSFLEQFAACVRVAASGDLYCVMGSGEWPTIDQVLRAQAFHWSATIIWAKQAMVLTRRKYHSRFEPIWFGWHKDGKSSFRAGRDQDDVWEFPRPMKSPLHPTMKPAELVARAIFNSSRPGDIVFDPFAGSGTTILAAESTGRICYANELLPRYVAVGLERLGGSGHQPVLIHK